MGHTPPAGADSHGDKATPKPDDTNAVGQALLNDLGNRYIPGTKPEVVNQLVQDGILPAGSTVLDTGKVRDHLAADQTRQTQLGKDQVDPTAAQKDVTTATAAENAAKGTLDAANAKVKPLEDGIAGRKAQDAEVQKDFGIVSGALKKQTVDKDDLEKLVKDPHATPEVKAAAQGLLGSFHDEKYMTGGGRGGRHEATRTTDDYTSDHFWSGKPYFNKESIAAGVAKHNEQNQADEKTLAPLKAAQTAAANAEHGTHETLDAKTGALNQINKDNTERTDLDRKIKEEQAALTPDGKLADAAKVVKGGGYYQVAENLLGIDDKKGPTTEQAKELRLLTHILQDEAKQLNGGHLPAYLKQNDVLLKPENLQRVMDRLQASEAPPPAPVTDPPPAPAPRRGPQ